MCKKYTRTIPKMALFRANIHFHEPQGVQIEEKEDLR